MKPQNYVLIEGKLSLPSGSSKSLLGLSKIALWQVNLSQNAQGTGVDQTKIGSILLGAPFSRV